MIVWQNLLLKVGRVMYVWFLTKTTRINVWLVCVLNQELSQVRPCVKYVSLKHGQNLIIFKDLFTTSTHPQNLSSLYYDTFDTIDSKSKNMQWQ